MRIDSGIVEGVASEIAPGAVAFLGVPYAAPTTGAWRWKPPRPAEPWPGVRAAREPGASCPQAPDQYVNFTKTTLLALGGDPSRVPPLGPTSEDCLFLNVWTANLGRRATLPVLVWLHGGGFRAGRGGDEAAALVRYGSVVVTLNSRLGALGFLAHPALTQESEHASSGNYGLLDQIEALRWVGRNIEAFGGDPERVLLFGNSSGGTAVRLLMESTLAAGLFRRAIVQSGPGGARPLTEAEAQGQEVALRLGAGTGDPLATLRGLEVETLLGADMEIGPVKDGWVLPGPGPPPARSGQAVPFIVGATTREFANLALVFPRAVPDDRDAYEALVGRVGGLRKALLLPLYPVAADDDVRETAIRFLTDLQFLCLARYDAATRRGLNWLYIVSAAPAAGPDAARLGPYHGSDMRLLFGLDYGLPVGDVGLRVGEAMRRYWVRFAATGDPNEPGLPEWPAYDGPAPRYLGLGEEIGALPGPSHAGCDVLDQIWSEQADARR